MNEKQNRLTVKKIDSYKSQARGLEHDIKREQWWVYGCSAVTILGLGVGYGLFGGEGVSEIASMILKGSAWAGLYLGVDHLKNMITNISEKSGLENLAETLQHEIDIANLEDKELNEGRVL
jgi:hypothetical protein